MRLCITRAALVIIAPYPCLILLLTLHSDMFCPWCLICIPVFMLTAKMLPIHQLCACTCIANASIHMSMKF